MIVDLERNDLGRVCRFGSVQVIEPRRSRRTQCLSRPATVAGHLREDVRLVDVLRASFPADRSPGHRGRAMQIIDELEPCRRGPYCGAIGYLSAGGTRSSTSRSGR